MTTLSTAALTASVGVAGVILGTILRPLVESWFAVRQKTLRVILKEPSEFRPPHETVTLNWHGEDVRRLIQTGFTLENKTKRTFRNFRLEISAKAPSNDTQIYAVYIEQNSRARYKAVTEGEATVFEFELLEPKTRLSGSMLSTYTDKLKITSLDDIEIYTQSESTSGNWRWFIVGVLAAATTLLLDSGIKQFIRWIEMDG